jgi:hypothetical protein
MCILQADNIFNNVLIHISARLGFSSADRCPKQDREKTFKVSKDLIANTIFVSSACIHKLFQGTLGVSSPQNSDLLQKLHAHICYRF